jgi:hypothetical protein
LDFGFWIVILVLDPRSLIPTAPFTPLPEAG